MNNVVLMGRITKDIELRSTQNGKSVVTFSMAVKRRFAKEGQPQADFINCVAWGQQAEFIAKFFNKGSMIAIVGNIQTRSWDGQDGKKQFATEIIVDEVHFTGEKKENATQGENDAVTEADFTMIDAPADDTLPF